MDLNLPILDRLQGCRSVLITGIGGGYDVFCGLPLFFTLRERGHQVHLANYSFSDIADHPHGLRLSPTLVGVQADHEGFHPYFPEYHLARWFKAVMDEDMTVWCFHKTACRTLTEDYRRLVEHLQVDAMVLVDGGVDSLMRGDEAGMGTLVEDAISLAAIRPLTGMKARILACIGLGAERDITYAHVFENIAALAKEGGFLGSCSLTRQMDVAKLYEDALLDVQSQRFHDPSVINSSILSALRGEFGDHHLTEKTRGSRLWISPLMSLYWFFDLDAVLRRNLVLDAVAQASTFQEAVMNVVRLGQQIPRRPQARVPL